MARKLQPIGRCNAVITNSVRKVMNSGVFNRIVKYHLTHPSLSRIENLAPCREVSKDEKAWEPMRLR